MAKQLVQRLSPLIEELLQASDLSTVSAKAIRKELVARGADKYEIKNFRAEIDDKITEIYNYLESKEAPAHNLEGSVSPSAKAPSSPPSLVEPKTVTRKRKTPTGENEETDEQMAKRLQGEYGGSRTRQQRSSRSARPTKKTRPKSQARIDSETERNDDKKDDMKTKRGGAFNKELLLSDSLADLVGTHSLSRPQVVKHIWAYVKERNLQDSNDKRYILCDDKLREVFHTDRLHMFTMNKILVNHLRDPEDIA
ncbi:upstream activation factor subunit UAF30 [Cryptococcus neoformans]|nr:upstream activation factor subunit UAF30 [Cryptococcus neoformans var. grubii c45]OXB34458.1 upstream activation factor subunit UAF30 [Cryptococcus neoformans var. grubii]OXC58580.1 upstream activation factor subunit UAF30 [Cryptococcus neoformans var. grubii MW-RSA852]